MKTDPKTIDTLRALLSQATPGPWRQDPAQLWGLVQGPTVTGVVAHMSRAGDKDGQSYDASLIAAAVNALPGLLDDVEELSLAYDAEYQRHEEHNAFAKERIADLEADNARLRAEVEALRRKPAPPTDEQPIPPLSVVRALSAPAYEDVLTDEERAACATIAAEVDALREVERLVRYAALARLDALRKEGT